MTRASRTYGWSNCPRLVRRQVLHFVSGLSEILASNLIGVYLHGSLAMGCFNPSASDIDLIVVTRRRVGARKQKLAALALAVSSKPFPIEVTSFSRKDLKPWRYPTSFDFHFSEDWRGAYESGRAFIRMGAEGEDPAANITEARSRGFALLGAPVKTALPLVPANDFVDSITSDLLWALRKLDRDRATPKPMSVYLTLNACRVLAYLETGQILSKAEGGDWALKFVPTKFRLTIRLALNSYRESGNHRGINTFSVRGVAKWAREKIRLRRHQEAFGIGPKAKPPRARHRTREDRT
jgi:predicted nucleotidyltransferase